MRLPSSDTQTGSCAEKAKEAIKKKTKVKTRKCFEHFIILIPPSLKINEIELSFQNIARYYESLMSGKRILRKVK